MARVIEGSHHRIFWRCVATRGLLLKPEILGCCRSEAVESPSIVHVLKLRPALHRFEELGCGSLRDCGFAWGRVKSFLVLKFLGFVDPGPFEIFVRSVL